MNNNRRIILPQEAMVENLNKMHASPPPLGGAQQVPMLQIPVKDDACYLLYAVAKYALDAEAFKELPIVYVKVQEMHDGLMGLYKRLNILDLEYKKFCVTVKPEEGEQDESVGQDEENA